LVELLLVVVVIAILAALLLPVLSRAQSKAKQTFCINNLKQLALCMQMYAADNDGKFVENPQIAQGGGIFENPTNAWVLGNMKSFVEATNEVYVRRGQLFAYARSPSLFHCPADRSQSNGVARTRSYSMNCWLGSRRMDSLVTGTPLKYRTFLKESELAAVGPARIWGVMDEYESTIDDGWFLVTMDDSRVFANLPAMRHRNSYSLNFGDGHTETYKILQGSIFSLQTSGMYNAPDWLRLKQVTTVR
jgi:type II secretory pathway pseudopilin PulG